MRKESGSAICIFSESLSNVLAPGSLFPFCLVPEGIELCKGELFECPARGVDLVLDLLKTTNEFFDVIIEYLLGIVPEKTADIDHGKEQIAQLLTNIGLVLAADGFLQFVNLLVKLGKHIIYMVPIKTGPRGPFLDLVGLLQCGQVLGYA